MTSQLFQTTWAVQDAKARFSELLDTCIAEGPQMVTKRGIATAVLVPVEVWRRLEQASRPSLRELLRADTPRTERLVPERRNLRRRTAQVFG